MVHGASRKNKKNSCTNTNPTKIYLSTSAIFLPVFCSFHMFVSDGSGKSLATAMLGYPANLPYHFCYLQLNCRMTQVFHLNDIHHSLGTDQNM
jgi:hypothetical protein